MALGLGLATLLIAWRGFGAVAGLLQDGGWRLLLLAGFALPNLALSTASWRLLFPPNLSLGFGRTLHCLWIGFSVNALLPVASVGGEAVRVRLLALWDKDLPSAVASIVVDKTVMVSTLLLSALLGAVLLVHLDSDGTTILVTMLGSTVLAGGVAAVVWLQRGGAINALVRRLAGQGGDRARRLLGGTAATEAALDAIYARPWRIVGAVTLRFGSRLLVAVELWIAAQWMGFPIGMVEAIFIYCIGHALRGAAFAVPAGVGVQEGSYVLSGSLVGLAPEASLALSLASRIREIVPSVLGLLAWQVAEGRALLGAGRAGGARG